MIFVDTLLGSQRTTRRKKWHSILLCTELKQQGEDNHVKSYACGKTQKKQCTTWFSSTNTYYITNTKNVNNKKTTRIYNVVF